MSFIITPTVSAKNAPTATIPINPVGDKTSPTAPRFTQHVLDVKDALIALNKGAIYEDNPRLYGQMDERTKTEPVVNFIEIERPNAYIRTIREEFGGSFIELIEETFEISVFIKRTTTKYMDSTYSPQTYQRMPYPFAQHIVIEILKHPDYNTHRDRMTVESLYRGKYKDHTYYERLTEVLKKRGILYIAEFDPKIITNRITALLQDKWEGENK